MVFASAWCLLLDSLVRAKKTLGREFGVESGSNLDLNRLRSFCDIQSISRGWIKFEDPKTED